MAPKNPPPAASDDETSGSEEEQQQPPPKPSAAAVKPSNSRSKPPPPSPPSDDDDDDEESDDESGSDEETDNKKNQPPAKVDKKPLPQIDSDSGSSDGSDSESESETIAALRSPRAPDPRIKPISSRPMDPSPSISKPKKSAAAAASPASPPLASSRKKPHPETSDQNGGETKKRKLFERIWSDDAEEKILKGIIDFYHRRGSSKPSISNSDMEALHEFLKDSFNGVEFTKAQLVNKIRRLKDKFKANSAKNGGSPNFTNSIDRTVYELSKKIWLPQEKANGNVGVASTKKGKESDTDEPDMPPKTPKKRPSNDVLVISDGANAVKEEFELAYPSVWEALTSAGTMKHADAAARKILSKVDSWKAAALEEKFRKYRKVELQNHLRWLELMKEVTKVSCEAVDRSD